MLIVRRFLGLWTAILLITALTACSSDLHTVPQSPSAPPDPPASANPTASFTAPSTATALQPVALDASASTSADGSALQYVWDFGNGQRGGGVKIAHLFSVSGNATVTLTVIDGSNRRATSAQTIAVSASAAAGSPVTVLVAVKDVDGNPLAGVTVTPGAAAAAVSDSTGQITVTVNAGATSSIKFSKPGYSDQFLNISEPQGSSNDGFFTVAMHTRDAALTLADAAAGGTLSGRDGATISLPAEGFIDSSGNPVSGPVQVSITPVDVTKAGAGGFPGDFKGIQPDGTQDFIASFGVEEFVPTVNGVNVQLAPGKTATIAIPLYATKRIDGTVVAVGDSMPLWSLDEATGIWVQEGAGAVVASAASPSGLALSAVVSHLSWWNGDIALGTDQYGPDADCVIDEFDADGNIIDELPVPCIVDASTYAPDDFGIPEFGDSFNPLPGNRAKIKQDAVTPEIAAFAQSYALASGGQPIQVPADVEVFMIAWARNGTYAGTATVHSRADTPVKIVLHSVTQAAPVAIALPFDDMHTLPAHVNSQFTFTAPAQSVARVIVTSTDGASYIGQLQLLQGSTALATSAISIGEPEQVLSYLPSAGTYTFAVTVDRPANVRLQASLEPGDGQVQAITLPFDGSRSLLPNSTADFSFTGMQNQTARIVVTGIDNSAANTATPLSGTVQLLEDGVVVGNATIVSGTAQLLVNLASTGTYTIEVNGTAGASFELITDTEASAVNDTLTIPTDITRSIAANSTYEAALTLSNATSVYFDSRHVSGDLTDVRLVAADGTVLFHAPPNLVESEITNSFVATLPAGSYSVLVNAQNGKLASERLFLSTTPWVPVAPTIPAGGLFQTADLVLDRNSKPVVGLVQHSVVNNQNSNTLQLRRWTGTAWETVGSDIVIGTSCSQTSSVSFAFDGANNPVVLFGNSGPAESSFFVVRRFSNGAWTPVGANGGQLAFTSASSEACEFPTTTLIGADDQPVVAYSSDAGAVVQHFDGTNWVGYVTPSGDLFGDYQAKFEARFDASGKLWIATGSGAQSNSAGPATHRLNTTTHAWDAVGGAFPQMGTLGLEQPRLRFDNAGSPVIAFLADVGSNGTSSGGVAVYRFDGSNWSTTGGHQADDISNGASLPDPGFIMFDDQAIVAWDSTQQNLQGFANLSSVVAQTNTGSGWTPIGAAPGWLPQYARGGLGYAIAGAPHLVTDGKDVYLSVTVAQSELGPDGLAAAQLSLLKKTGN
jgi:PKD domain